MACEWNIWCRYRLILSFIIGFRFCECDQKLSGQLEASERNDTTSLCTKKKIRGKVYRENRPRKTVVMENKYTEVERGNIKV